MAEFHFTKDYVRLVKRLKETYELDEAMHRAVGSPSRESYALIGDIASDILVYAGAVDGHSILDFGCGSGRVAHCLARKIVVGRYLGLDVVQDLLDYAKTITPSHFEYRCHREISIPAENESFDVACAFSVFTHLLHTESYGYLTDIVRTLRPNGVLVASFLEFAMESHWIVFLASVASKGAPHLNMFIERNQWEVWARHTGLKVVEFIDGHACISRSGALGQSITIFRKDS